MGKITVGLALLVVLANIATAENTTDNEWYGFDYNEAGISVSEFDMVKAKGMSRAQLLELLEIGVMPSEYFEEPWKKLGVSKSHWIRSKKQGLEDSDIDKTVYTRAKFNYYPLVSFALPGFYSYKTKRFKTGFTMTGVFAASFLLTFMHKTESGPSPSEAEKKINPLYPIIAVMACVWSSTDAYLGTRFSNNSDASRFTLIPTLDKPGAQVLLRF